MSRHPVHLSMLIVAVLAAAAATPAFAQVETDGRIWLSVNVQERSNTSSAWRWAADAYLRTRDGVGDLDSSSGRIMVGYDLTPGSTLWVGVTAGGAFPAAGGFTLERRLFQQHSWARAAGAGSVTLRTRLEQRFIEGNRSTVWRVREQVRFSRPLPAGSRLALVVWDEIFFNLNDTSRFDRGLDQHRIFAGLARPLHGVRLEVGYLNQFSHSRTGPDRANHVLSSTASVSF